jgi:endonuclease YncB( thermonuclease family)
MRGLKMKTLFALILIFLAAIPAMADQQGQMAEVTKILKGDTMVVSIRGHLGDLGTGMIVHVAGVDAPELDQSGGRGAFNYLTKLTLHQKVNIIVVLTSPDGTHGIARVALGESGNHGDVGQLILSNGWGFFRADERNGLNAVQNGTYPGVMQNAEYGKKGLWVAGQGAYTMTADSFRSLQLWKYNQQYVNGTLNPTQDGFNRPSMHQATGPGDWRNYSFTPHN